MVNLALAWAEAYAQVQPQLQIAVTGGGSGTGIASLINGTVDMANASRQIKPEERRAGAGQRDRAGGAHSGWAMPSPSSSIPATRSTA
jgi:ABC-type phosphate transport system substrate-binding protein